MAKQVIFDSEVREALKRGVDIVAGAVRVTIGPRGRNVALDKSWGTPTITNDGVSIAKDITLPNKFENMGASIVKEVATKTNDKAGDGTTTAVVLLQALVHEGLKRTSLGANAVVVRRGIEAGAKDAVEELRKMAKPVKGTEDIRQVATISAESAELGKTIADIVEKVGKDGVVTVEDSQTFGIESDFVEGMEFEKGYISQYMITNAERMEAEAKDVAILVTDRKISTVKDILPLLEKVMQSGKKELVIIADDVDGEALTTFIVNKLRGIFSVLAIKAPGFNDGKRDTLADIAATVGAQVISEDLGLKLENADLSMLGRASRVVATKDTTIIVGGKGKKVDIANRVDALRAQMENMDPAKKKWDRENLKKRIAKMSGGVAVIRVGAATETEMKYLKDKIEDAVNATKAAIAEGIIPGGGSALAKVSDKLAKKLDPKAHDEYTIGYRILLKALNAPLLQIAQNAGREDGAVILQEVIKKGGAFGYDAASESLEPKIVDMYQAGIIDPVKVTRSGVENAASAAAVLLTTEAAVADIPEEPKPQAPDMGGM